MIPLPLNKKAITLVELPTPGSMPATFEVRFLSYSERVECGRMLDSIGGTAPSDIENVRNLLALLIVGWRNVTGAGEFSAQAIIDCFRLEDVARLILLAMKSQRLPEDDLKNFDSPSELSLAASGRNVSLEDARDMEASRSNATAPVSIRSVNRAEVLDGVFARHAQSTR